MERRDLGMGSDTFGQVQELVSSHDEGGAPSRDLAEIEMREHSALHDSYRRWSSGTCPIDVLVHHSIAVTLRL